MEELLDITRETRQLLRSQIVMQNSVYFEDDHPEQAAVSIKPSLTKSTPIAPSTKPMIIPNNLKNRDLDCVKAQEFSNQSKSDSSGCLGIHKQEDKVTLPDEKSSLITHATSRLDEMKLLLKKHASSQFKNELPIWIKLLTIHETSLPFYQKLELAIHEAFLPAKAYVIKGEKDFQAHLPSLKILLAPLDEVNAFVDCKNAEIHTLTKIDKTIYSIYWLPLYPCASYIKDVELKRSLWNKLKSLPFADLLA